MRRTVLAAVVALTLLLASAGAAVAADLPSHRAPGAAPPSAVAGPGLRLAPAAHFAPLGAKLAGTAVVNGHVYDSGGGAIYGAYVAWAVTLGDTFESGDTQTDATGAYSFTNLPAAPGTGELLVASPTEPWAIGRYDATWADPGTTTFDFQPGVVTTVLLRGGPWVGWGDAMVFLFGSDAVSGVAGMTDIAGSSDAVSGYSYGVPGTYQDGAAYFWMDEGKEFTTTATLGAGAVSAETIVVDQATAQRLMVTTPYWASGKPGTAIKVRHENYPAGWTLDYYGYADSPTGKPFKSYGSLATTGASPFSKGVTIPTTAPAGYCYVVNATHREGPLSLDTPFQVCTLKSTKTAVRKGDSIKLGGVIPTEGRWGSNAGKSKYVTIYKRTKSVSAAPTAWDATKKGWTKVAKVKANGLGKYASAYLKPTRTTWYVVRYPGDNWYWGAYTSVVKVRVY